MTTKVNAALDLRWWGERHGEDVRDAGITSAESRQPLAKSTKDDSALLLTECKGPPLRRGAAELHAWQVPRVSQGFGFRV